MKPAFRPFLALAALCGLFACNKPSAATGDQVPPARQEPQAPAKAPDKAAPDKAPEKAPAGPAAGLLDPTKANATAPDQFTVKLETTKGDLLLDVHRAWAPIGADRFFNLVKVGYLDDTAFFRVIKGFMAQTGINGDPKVSSVWRAATIKDDPVVQHNKRGFVSFATAGPNSRTTQYFINFVDGNVKLDDMGFAPFAQLHPESLAVLDALNSEYGEGAPAGAGPSQGLIQQQGNGYLRSSFPRLDWIKTATIVR